MSTEGLFLTSLLVHTDFQKHNICVGMFPLTCIKLQYVSVYVRYGNRRVYWVTLHSQAETPVHLHNPL